MRTLLLHEVSQNMRLTAANGSLHTAMTAKTNKQAKQSKEKPAHEVKINPGCSKKEPANSNDGNKSKQASRTKQNKNLNVK